MTSERWLRKTFLHIADLKRDFYQRELSQSTSADTHRFSELLFHDFAILQELRFLILQTVRPILIVGKKFRFLLLPDLHRCYRRCALINDGCWMLLDHRLWSRRLILLRLPCFGFLYFSLYKHKTISVVVVDRMRLTAKQK